MKLILSNAAQIGVIEAISAVFMLFGKLLLTLASGAACLIYLQRADRYAKGTFQCFGHHVRR